MNKLQNIIAYLYSTYPYKEELSNARLTKMVYLSDWFSSLLYRRQLTDIRWVFNHYGPYVDDVINVTSASPYLFRVRNESNYYGSIKTLIEYIGTENAIQLNEDEKKVLDLVIEKTKSLNFNGFIEYIYSTYPIRSNSRYSVLDLPRLANEYAHDRN